MSKKKPRSDRDTLGCRPNLPEGFHPSDSLHRFAADLSRRLVIAFNLAADGKHLLVRIADDLCAMS